jgi:hypothetical protein
MAEQPVRLVLLGGASAAPVCDDDVCYLPDSTVDYPSAPSVDREEHPDLDGEDTGRATTQLG